MEKTVAQLEKKLPEKIGHAAMVSRSTPHILHGSF